MNKLTRWFRAYEKRVNHGWEITKNDSLPMLAGIVLALLLMTGCDEPTRQERFETSVVNIGTPSDATNIEFIDGQWYTFEWRDQCFLGMKYWRHAAVTKIDCEDKMNEFSQRQRITKSCDGKSLWLAPIF